jgi:hypothetical protein
MKEPWRGLPCESRGQTAVPRGETSGQMVVPRCETRDCPLQDASLKSLSDSFRQLPFTGCFAKADSTDLSAGGAWFSEAWGLWRFTIKAPNSDPVLLRVQLVKVH